MQKSKKRLDWTPSALAEFENGIAYYAERNPVAARRMQEEINRAALSLIAATIPVKGKHRGAYQGRANWFWVHIRHTSWFFVRLLIRRQQSKSCV